MADESMGAKIAEFEARLRAVEGSAEFKALAEEVRNGLAEIKARLSLVEAAAAPKS